MHAESLISDDEGGTCQDPKVAESVSCGLPGDSSEPCGSKCLRDEEVLDHEAKRSRCGDMANDEVRTSNHETDDAVVEEVPMKVDASSENVYEKFYCTVCGDVAKEIHEHPLLKVIVCEHCKSSIEVKMKVSLLS